MQKIWTLILVKKGFIQEPEIFFSKQAAEKRKTILMADFNKDYDEIEIFEIGKYLKATQKKFKPFSTLN